jgi:hypothetical protein
MNGSRLLQAGLLASALAFSPQARADEPTQAEVDHRPDRYPPPGTGSSLVLGGAGVALGGYAVAFGSSYLWSEAPTASDLRLPVAGPVLAIAGAGCGAEEAGCGNLVVVVRSVFAALSGMAQIGGLALMAEGLFLPTAGEAPSSAQSADRFRGTEFQSTADATPRFIFSPVASDTTFGFNVAGQF